MSADFQFRPQELHDDELQELLGEEGTNISVESAALIKNFLAQFGSVDEALAAIEQLRSHRDAA